MNGRNKIILPGSSNTWDTRNQVSQVLTGKGFQPKILHFKGLKLKKTGKMLTILENRMWISATKMQLWWDRTGIGMGWRWDRDGSTHE